MSARPGPGSIPLNNHSHRLAERLVSWIRAQGRPAWLVGGSVRDQLLGRPSHDLDLIVPDGAIRLARSIASKFGGDSFVLDAGRDVGRAIVTDAGDHVEVDVARLRVPDLRDDLALRDFTVNAMAVDLTSTSLAVFDPFDGQADLARGLLRAVTEGAFRDDPLRMLRAVRMSGELGFRIEAGTASLVRRDAQLITSVAGERVRDELRRLLALPDGWTWVRTLLDLDLLRHTLPEAAAQVGVPQSPPHYQDVFGHTLSVLAHVELISGMLWPGALAEGRQCIVPPFHMAGSDWCGALHALLAPYAEVLRTHLELPLSATTSRRDLLPWGALTHDWGKPAKQAQDNEGRIHFHDHERWGALLVENRLQVLRFSANEVAYVARLTDLHMRPAFLARDYPPSRRAVYRYYRDAGNTGPDLVLLSLADHMATHAADPDPDRWRARLDTAALLLGAFCRERSTLVDPTTLLNGDQLMSEFALTPGPQVGELLAGLREAQATGEVENLDGARLWVRRRLEGAC